MKLCGRPTSFSACSIASTASPRETPGAVLNETVVAGSCPKWVINSGPVRSLMCTIAESGTCPLVVEDDEGRYIADNPSSERCSAGSTSMITRYWFDWVYIV